MKKLTQSLNCQKCQQDPKLATVNNEIETHCDQTALSDAELGQVSAAGDVTVPTMDPEVLLGRHALPSDAMERKQ